MLQQFCQFFFLLVTCPATHTVNTCDSAYNNEAAVSVTGVSKINCFFFGYAKYCFTYTDITVDT